MLLLLFGVRQALKKHNAKLTPNLTIYFRETNGEIECCALGALALSYCGLDSVRGKTRNELIEMVSEASGWDEEDLLNIESGFENLTLRSRAKKYEIGQKIREMALAI